ncbi:MAG: hypothetical protein IID16_00775 [Candidatus Marinimicrobia bacterium]|nr:hypothetical protein [Candidatus Neomarinimicrobiota bacterium]
MNYTRGKLIVSPAYGENGEVLYYNVERSGQSLASFHENQYINVDMDQAKGNAELYAKSAEMFEALKTCKSFIDSHSVALLDAEIELKKKLNHSLKK